jgi:hypothetical protein
MRCRPEELARGGLGTAPMGVIAPLLNSVPSLNPWHGAPTAPTVREIEGEEQEDVVSSHDMLVAV